MMENYDDLLTETAPAEQSDYDKASWKNRKKAEREEAFARVADAALQISGSPTLLQNYLNVQAQFDRYSVNNCLLIATSKPEGTAFKDFDGWKKEGVSIAKGETGIVLLVPGKTYIAKGGTEKQSFDTKRVFDISQTTALHKAAPIVQYDPRVLLKALLRQAPCKVEAKDDMNPKINAAYQPNTKSIDVRPGMDAPDIFRLVAQEIVHAMHDGENYKRGDWSFRASCAAYILCKRFHVSVDAFDFSNVKTVCHDKNAAEMQAELNVIRDTANKISGGMEQELGTKNRERHAECRNEAR